MKSVRRGVSKKWGERKSELGKRGENRLRGEKPKKGGLGTFNDTMGWVGFDSPALFGPTFT